MSALWDKISALEAQLRQVEAERDELRNERDMAAARAMAFEQGKCPGIPLDDGRHSGCEGGGDCPVCKGQTFDAQAQCNRARAEVVMLREELGLGLGDAMQRVASLAREVIDLRQERDKLRAAARAFLEDASMPQCGACREQGVIRIVTRKYRGWFACDQHDSGLGWKDLPHAASLRALRALLGGAS